MLEPHLEAVDLPLRKELEARNKRIDHVYFIESGFASVVANGSTKPGIEIGIIGREGMTGLSVVLGSNRRAHTTPICKLRAMANACSATCAKQMNEQGPSSRDSALRHAFLFQTTSTALANGRSKIEERLARWLLMAEDRIDGDELPLTHEFLSLMLGVRRPGVTIALQALEREGLIAHRRAIITILDREGLEAHSNGTYVPLLTIM